MRALAVTHAFGDYTPGMRITDKDAMKAALATNPGFVVPVNLPEEAIADGDAGSQGRAAKGDAPKAASDAPAAAPKPSAAS